MGWTGVNIEPVPCHFEKLCKNRPDSINLNVALSHKIGEAKFTNALHPRLGNYFGNGSIRHADDHLQLLKRMNCTFEVLDVITTTFAEIVDILNLKSIDLFVLDVEGYEIEVLQGMKDTSTWPKIMCIEYTSCGNQLDSIMKSYGYSLDKQVEANSYYIYHGK
jgi:FkbM family methyltransferase